MNKQLEIIAEIRRCGILGALFTYKRGAHLRHRVEILTLSGMNFSAAISSRE